MADEFRNTGSDVVSRLLSKLPDAKRSGSGWQSPCPAHEDSKPSLSISQGEGGSVLLKCHAGCESTAVVAALDMKMRDLFPPRPEKRRPAPRAANTKSITVADIAIDKGLPEDFLRKLGVEDHPRGVTITYRLENGNRAERRRLRLARKAKDGSKWQGTGALVPYGLDLLERARTAGFLVIAEGESDSWTLWFHDYPALGLPGAGMSGLLQESHIQGIPKVYVICEPDKAGDKFVQGVAARSRELGWTGKVYEVKLSDAKDPNDLHKKSPADFKAAFQAALDAAPELTTATTAAASDGSWRDPYGRYFIDNDQTFQIRFDREGNERHVRLSNFAARIVEETVMDDGAEEVRVLSVEGHRTGGRPLPLVRVPVAKFSIMNWPLELWGISAFLEPGLGAKEQLRAAIQTYSGDEVPRRTVYRHTGWRELAGQWLYLSSSGAIGANGVEPNIEVNLTGPLARYDLPAPPTADERIAAIRASLSILDVAPYRITVPCFAAIYRAALGETDLGIHVAGPSGSHKTGIAALCQQHYGATMDERNLPGSWSSTGNALEALAFWAKDAVLTIDDFAPTGSSNDVQRTHRDADRVFRAQGNQSGRHRMNADATLKAAKPPRGLIISTGEDVPKGQSLRARLLITEMSRSDIDLPRLTACQKSAGNGLFAQSLSGFVQSLAPTYGMVKVRLLAERNELAVMAARSQAHRRTPRIIADLALGLKYFLAYAREAGAITEAECSSYWRDGWQALGEAANAQAKHQNASDPAVRFIELLSSAIATGEAHLAGIDGGTPQDAAAWGWRERVVGTGEYARQELQPHGKRIGWINEDNLYLDPDGAFAAAQEMGRKIGDALTITAQTMWKRLNEADLLVTIDLARETLKVRRKLEGREHGVIHLRLSGISSANEPDVPDIGDATLANAGHPVIDRLQDVVGNVGIKNVPEASCPEPGTSSSVTCGEDGALDATGPMPEDVLALFGTTDGAQSHGALNGGHDDEYPG